MRVSQIMNPDALDAGLLRAAVHLMVEIILGEGENTRIRMDVFQRMEILLHH